jgi:CheY-like chemotaxis protein
MMMSSQASDQSIRVPSLVLLVEDDAIIALTTQMLLEEIGVEEVRVAGSVADALGHIAQARFDLAVLDLNLGRETSLPVAEQLFAQLVPVIFATGYGDTDLPEAYKSARILSKPYRLDDLRRAIMGA